MRRPSTSRRLTARGSTFGSPASGTAKARWFRPGALRSFLDLLGPEDDVARFEYLKKSARNFGSVLIGIETKNKVNFDTLFKRFDEAGWAYQDITDNETIAGLII